MKRLLTLFVTLILVVSMLFVGCGSKNENAGNTEGTNKTEATANPAAKRSNAADTVVIGTPAIKGEILPVYFSTTYDGWVANALFDGLLEINKDGEFIPMIAESFELSEDKLTYTFKMREDVKFSNGEPLTANDVKFTYQILADPSYDGRYTHYVKNLVGHDEYKSGEADNLEGIKVIDDYNISFTFKEARSNNIAKLDMPVLSKDFYAYEYNNTKAVREKMNNFEVCGSGPYKLVKFEPTQYVEFVRNDEYFLGQPKTEKLIYKMVTVDTQMAELEKGEIDVLMHVPPSPENFAFLNKLNFAKANAYTSNGYGYMGYNMKDDILKDIKVRQALTYGFDRDVFLQKYYDGHAETLNAPLSPVNYAFTDELKGKLNPYKYDKEKAIALLEEAGWKVGADGVREKDGKKLSLKWLTYTDSKYVETLIPMLKAYWGQIGVDLQVEQMEFNSLVDRVYVERNFQLYNMSWTLDNLPTGNYEIFHSEFSVPDGNNSVAYEHPRSDELLINALLEFDRDKQIKIIEEWALLFNEQLPYMIIGNNEEVEFVNDRIENFNTSSYIYLDDIVKDITIK